MADLSGASAPGRFLSPSEQAAALHQYLRLRWPRFTLELALQVIQGLAPTAAENIKALAKRLRRMLAGFGFAIKQEPALEAAARIKGHANWHTSGEAGQRGTPIGMSSSSARPHEAMDPIGSGRGLLAVDNPEVDELLDVATSQYVSHRAVIGDDDERASQLRLQLQTDKVRENPRYLCAQCMTPVYLVCLSETRKYFFRHSLEDGRCSAITRGQLSQQEINARKYNGLKEGWQHQEMKRWVAECLRADLRFSDVVVEGRWTGQFSGAWRKPDVRATFDGVKVAFEIQLSTTYINVIAERREFYLNEGGLLFWVFAQFPEGPRRLTQDDVYYNNNRNVFIVDKSTREESLRDKQFKLECVWAEALPGGEVSGLQRAVVPFDKLTLEQDKQRAYFYDFDGRRAVHALEAQEREKVRRTALSNDFESWYVDYVTTKVFDDTAWASLRQRFNTEGVVLPEYPGMLPRGLLNVLYSTKHGRVIGWQYTSFIQVAHYVEPGHRDYLQVFRRAIAVYGRAAQLQSEDVSGKWAAKVVEYKPKLRAGDPAYAPDTKHEMLVRLLFPELFRASS